MEEVENAGLAEEGCDCVGRLCTGLEPLQDLFLVERDDRLLVVRIVETDLFDEAVVAGLAVVDNDGAVNGIVSFAEAGETNHCCHENTSCLIFGWKYSKFLKKSVV